MIRRPPRSTRTDTLFPYTTLFRSHRWEFPVGFLIDDDGLPAAASISMWRRAMEKAILRCLVHGGEGLGLAGHGALHGRTLLHALEVLAIVRAGRHVEAKLGGPVVEHEDKGKNGSATGRERGGKYV